MPKTTLKDYKTRFDLDGEGGDLLNETARESLAWLGEHSEEKSTAQRLLKRWLFLTGFTPCPCPTCKRRRNENLDAEDLAYEIEMLAATKRVNGNLTRASG